MKEVGDINSFVRRHMLEGSDATDFIHNRLRPHFNELDACWRAIERAQNQLDALKPIADAHDKIEEAKLKRQHLQGLLDVLPLFYAHRHLTLRREEAIELEDRLGELRGQKQDIEAVQKRYEDERDAKLQEFAVNITAQSIARIETQMAAADERRKSKLNKWNEFAGHLRMLNRLVPVESSEQFERVQSEASAQQGLLKGNRDSVQEKQVQQLMERQRAVDDRSRVAGELETLRKHRVLIPREFVVIREAICLATHVPVEDLPFAGELIEVKAEHREWTGAIERLLHQFGVSLLVPERHYVAVSEFINRQHLGLRFTFHRVSSAAASRTDASSDSTRVAGRLNFRDEHSLAGWVKSEVARRFNHVCCADVNRLKEVDYGITREGLIRDGPTRHTKDDRRAVNDATNYVLGWSVEDKIRALTTAYEQADKREKQATQKATEAAEQFKKLEAQLKAIEGVLAISAFADIDHELEKREFARLNQEKDELEASSNSLKALRKQLEAVKQKLELSKLELEKTDKQIWTAEADEKKNREEVTRLNSLLKPHANFDPESFAGEFGELQEKGKLTLKTISIVEDQVSDSIKGQMSHQTRLVNEANEIMLPLMANFLRDCPEHSANLRAEANYAGDFAALRTQIDKEELPQSFNKSQAAMEFFEVSSGLMTKAGTSKRIENEALAQTVALGITNLLSEDYQVYDKNLWEYRAAQLHDIAVLCRTNDDSARIADELRAVKSKSWRVAAVAATAAIVRRRLRGQSLCNSASRSRRDCGNREAETRPCVIRMDCDAAVAATAAIVRRKWTRLLTAT